MLRISMCFILILTMTACKKGELVQQAESQKLNLIQKNVLDYNAQTLSLSVQMNILVKEIEAFHRIYFYTNDSCSGAPLANNVAQSLPTSGVTLVLENSSPSKIYFRSDTHDNCYFGFDYTPQLDPVPPPTFTRTIPVSPSRDTYSPAIIGSLFPSSSSVELFTDDICTQSVGQGTAQDFSQQGLIVTLVSEAITSVYARTTDPRGKKSACALLTQYSHNTGVADAIRFVATEPLSPSTSITNPVIRVNPHATTETIRIYSDPACTLLLAEETAANALNNGIGITVPSNQTTHLYSVAINDDGDPTGCGFLTSYTHDNIAPTIPTYTAAAPPSPTNTTTLPLITGTAPADAARVRLFNSPTCSQSIGFGSRAQFISTGVTANLLPNTTTQIYAASEDSAGNRSACTFMTSYKHNNIRPAPPVFAYTVPASPTNISFTPTIFGTADFGVVTVRLYTDETCSTLVGSATATDFETVGISVTLAPNTETLIYATSEDVEGNFSFCTGIGSFEHSDTPAPPPVFTVAYPPSPTKTTNTPYISGTAPSSVTNIELYLDASCSVLQGTATRGIFSTTGIQITVPTNTTSTVYGLSRDVYGNASNCQMLTNYTHTNLPPLNPTYSHTTPASPTNTSFTPTIFGSVFTNPASPLTPTLISFYDGDACIGKIGEGTPGNFETIGVMLSVAQNAITPIYARVFDAATNSSDCTYMTTFTHNTLKPGRPILGTLSPGSPSYTPLTRVTGTYGFSTDFMSRMSVSFYSDISCTNEIMNVPEADLITGVDVPLPPNATTPLTAASFNTLGNRSDCSLLVNFNTYDTPPQNLVVTPDVDGSLVMTWTGDAVAFPSPTYSLKRSVASGGPYTTVYTGATNGYTDENVTHGTTYYYVVQASNSTGETLNSAEMAGTVAAAPPSPGVLLTATPGPQRVQLNWSGFNQNMGYVILRALQPGGPYTELPLKTASANYVDNDVVNGTTYYYVVKGYNTAGKSIISNEARSIPLVLPPVINDIWAVPQLSSPSCGGNPGLHIYWIAPPYYQSFRVNRVAVGDPNGNSTTNPTVPSYVDCNPYPGSANRYQVRTLWGATYTDASPYVEFVLGTTTFTTNAGDGYVKLNWSADPSATSIEIFKSEEANGPFVLLTTSANTGTYTDNAVVNGQGYFYYIQARDGTRVMGWPSSKLSAVPGADPGAPTNLSLYLNSSNGVELSWTAPTHFNQFAIYRASSIGGPYSLVTKTPNMNLTDVTAPAGLNYYQVKTLWGDFESAPSNIVSYRKANLTGFAVSNQAGSVNLSWASVAGISDYRVERAISAAGPFSTIAFPVTASYSDTSASLGQGYYYRINARFADTTEGQKSVVLPGQRTGTNIPSGLSILTTTTSSVGVGWVAVPGASQYTLWSSTNIGGPYDLIYTTPTGSTVSYTFSGLTARTQYYFKVAAVISAVEYQSSPIAAATLANPSPPMGTIGNNLVQLTWSAVTGANTYSLERSADGVNFTSLVSGLAVTTYTDTTALNGEKYFYRLIAHFDVGDRTSLASGPYSPGRVPVAPASLSVVGNSTGVNVSLSWTTSPGATSYRIYRATSDLGPFTQAVSTPNATNVAVTGLTPGVVYYFYVTALDGNNESVASPTVATMPNLSPAAPIALFASPGVVNISWGAVAEAATYDLYRSTDGFNFEKIAADLVATTFDDNTLLSTLNYFYYYQPKPVDDVKLAKSGVSTGIALQPEPLKPLAFGLSSPDSINVNLSWEAIPQAAYYEIYRSTTSGMGYTLVTTVNAPTATAVDSTIVMGETYYYVMRAFNAVGVPSPYSDEKNIMIDNVPVNLLAANNGTVIDLSWDVVPGASDYNVWRSTVSGGPYGLIGTTVTNTFSDTQGTPNTVYYYVVSAIFPGSIESAKSVEASALKDGALSFQHAIELIDRGVASLAGITNTFERSRTSFDTSDYDGVVTYQLEFIATNTDSINRTVALVNGAGAVVSSILIPANTLQPERFVQAMAPALGAQTWRLQLEGSSVLEDVKIFSGRVVITQTNASKTKLYIPLLTGLDTPSSEDLLAPVQSTQQTTFQRLNGALSYKRQVQKLSELPMFNAWTLETLVAQEGGAQGVFALHNATRDSVVDKTVTEFTQASPILTKIPINEGTTLFASANEDDEYNIALRCRQNCGVGTVHLYKAGLWVKLENLTKAQIYLRTALSGDVNANSIEESGRAFMDMSLYTNPTVYHQATVSSNGGADIYISSVGTTDVGFAGAVPVATSLLAMPASSDFITYRSPALGLTSTHRYVLSIDTATPTQVHGSLIVIDVQF